MRTSHITILVVAAAAYILLFSSLQAQSPEGATLIVTDHEIPIAQPPVRLNLTESPSTPFLKKTILF